jgi:hypothetical protein
MAKSEPENWRLPDASDGAKYRAQSVTANGSAGPHPGDPRQETEPLPAVEIRYPKSIEDDARAYKNREERREQWRLVLQALTVVAIFAYGALTYRQWRTVQAATDNSTGVLQSTERAYAAALRDTERTYAAALQASDKTHVAVIQATERAYVTLGSKTGEPGEFFGNARSGENRIIALHFYNSGHSTARHLAVHLIRDDTGLISRRHRFKGPQGDIVSIGISTEDLAPGAEHLEYVTSPWSQKESADNMTENFTISGQFEYCDVFGTYHCQEFSTNYMPNLRQFASNSVQSCAVEAVTSTDTPGKGYVEIAPCEQPDELDAQIGIPRIAPGARTSGSKVE